ncbi:MAG: M20/M25/M40 family metallo-hydrolase, partial [Myxococcota bacterium]
MRGETIGRLCLVALAVLLALPARAQLAAEDLEIRVLLAEQQPEMEKLLADWVDRNTGTWNIAGLEAFAPLIAEPLKALGFEVTIEPGAAFEYPDRKDARTGPLIVAQRKAQIAPERARHFLLLGHADTVFEPDSDFQKFAPDPNSPRRAIGPGVNDMKGGLVVLLYALRALAESGDLSRADYTVVVNADEEIGSLGSRSRIEAESRSAQLGFVFEPAREGGEMARSRSGIGQFHLSV